MRITPLLPHLAARARTPARDGIIPEGVGAAF
jgi:hypothetical protein